MVETYFVINPDGSIKSFVCEDKYRLDYFYKIIGCVCVEQVRTIFRDLVIVIDESGKVKDPPQPHNEIASRLYHGYRIGIDNIVGPAILVMLHPVGPLHELDWRPLTRDELGSVCKFLGVCPDK